MKEYLTFPKDTYYLTQGYGNKSYSHRNRLALDVSGKNGNPNIYAPFSGYVAKKYVKKGQAYSIWLVSNEKVICADGNEYFVVAMFTHPWEIANFYVGQTFKQNDFLMKDGNTGQSTGNHLDFEIAIYENQKDINANWKRFNGDWGLINRVNPCDYMCLKDNCPVLNDMYNNKKYEFKRIKDIPITPKPPKEEWTVGNYKILVSKTLRTSCSLATTNRVKVKQVDNYTKTLLTSSKPNDIALFRIGVKIPIHEIIKEKKGRIWGRYYNVYIVICNQDGTAQSHKID